MSSIIRRLSPCRGIPYTDLVTSRAHDSLALPAEAPALQGVSAVDKAPEVSEKAEFQDHNIEANVEGIVLG